jgi:hypothetical protein
MTLPCDGFRLCLSYFELLNVFVQCPLDAPNILSIVISYLGCEVGAHGWVFGIFNLPIGYPTYYWVGWIWGNLPMGGFMGCQVSVI